MNRFTADFSSSIASERLPSNSRQRQYKNIFSAPDDVVSTTPAAPPPSQLFDSSQLGTGVSKLQFTGGSNAFPFSAPRSQSSQRPQLPAPTSLNDRRFQSSVATYATEDGYGDYTDDMMDEYEEEQPEELAAETTQGQKPLPSLLKFSTSRTQQLPGRPVNRAPIGVSRSQLPRKGRPDIVPGLARDVAKRLGEAEVMEPDEIIIDIEDLLRSCDEECQKCDTEAAVQIYVTGTAHELISQWKKAPRSGPVLSGQNPVGLGSDATPLEKAQYLALLLLSLRHPGRVAAAAGAGSLIFADGQNSNQISTPELLLEWLDDQHVNYGPLFEQVINTTPAPSANELYWDAIETFTLRGKFDEVMELLKRADMNYAVIDGPDGSKNANFTGTQLQQAEDAIYKARQLINTCPAFQTNDWALEGQDWDVYRKQLEAEIERLAEQVSPHNYTSQQTGSLDMFGKLPTELGLPFVIYQRLKTIYSIMLGDAEEIIGLAQDWVEASLLLTVWWIPADKKSVARWSFDVSRANEPSLHDVNPYLKRLSDAFLCVTDPDLQSGFQLNTMDPVDVGLGAILQGDVQSCLRVLRSLSVCVVSAVAEVGTMAGWLASLQSSVDLDQHDLMVLNYGSNDAPITKDDILEDYARMLFAKDILRAQDGTEVEGWELSFSILSRLDDQERLHSSISQILNQLPVTSQERAAKLVDICEQFGLQTEGRKVSETFADGLVESTTEYGTALLCYARAHAEHKVRQLVDLLNSYCLVQSKAYPAADDLDPALSQLVSNPKSAFQSIADADPTAAEVLQFHLVGYACLRRFYSLRDNTIPEGTHLHPLARRRAAAKALVAAVNSAADSIYGGLYDPSRQSAIQVDGLLTLLGEATAFLGHGKDRGILSLDHMYTLLAAIEDLQTVSDRVYRAAEECMGAALRNHHGSLPPSPHAMLKKSISSGTNSSFSFSMMGSEMLARSEESFGGKSLDSAMMLGRNQAADETRGWDWRTEFQGSTTTGADVLQRLRLDIAKELSLATVEGTSFVRSR